MPLPDGKSTFGMFIIWLAFANSKYILHFSVRQSILSSFFLNMRVKLRKQIYFSYQPGDQTSRLTHQSIDNTL